MTESLVRVQVVGHGRRLDVCLPADVPLWEFLPEVARGLGAGDTGDEAVVGALVTTAGQRLDGGGDLRRQGVRHGDVLTLAPAAEHHPPVVHDDLVQAVHARARVVLAAWSDAAAGTAAYVVACVALTAALAFLVGVSSTPEIALTLAGALALALGVVAHAAHRQQAPSWSQVLTGWLAVGCAWVVGAALGPGLGGGGAYAPVVAALAVGVAVLLAAGRRWPLHTPPLLVVAVWSACGVVAATLQVPAWQVVLVALTAGVLVAGVVPGTVVELTVARSQVHPSGHVDVRRVDADLLLAHRIVLAWSLTGTGLTLCVVPGAVASGASGVAALALVSGLRLLRVRRQRSASLVLAAVAGTGVAALFVLARVAVLHPEWLPSVVVGLACLAGVVASMGRAGAVAATGGDTGGSWRAWCADVVEVAAVVLLPLAVTAALWWPRW